MRLDDSLKSLTPLRHRTGATQTFDTRVRPREPTRSYLLVRGPRFVPPSGGEARLTWKNVMKMSHHDALLTTREAAERIGVSTATVKRWTDQGELRCERTPGGHRKFHPDEVERLARKLRGTALPRTPLIDLNEVRDAALGGDASKLYTLSERWVRSGGDLDGLFDDVFHPVLRGIGEDWSTGRATVADEHTATTACAEAINRLAVFIDERPLRGTAVSACLAGEHHGVAAQMAGLILRTAGYHTLVPGTDTPDDDLLALIDASDARVVCLSASSVQKGDCGLSERVGRIGALLQTRGARYFLGGDGFAPPFKLPAPAVRLQSMRALNAALRAPRL